MAGITRTSADTTLRLDRLSTTMCHRRRVLGSVFDELRSVTEVRLIANEAK
jgi:hypothetical protein